MLPPRITLTFKDEHGRPRRVEVGSARFNIGRSSDSDLSINNASLSRRHAVIEINNNSAYVSDCGSQNGTTVNGFPLTGAAPLHSGDVITLGGAFDIAVTFAHQAAPAAELAAAPAPSPGQQSSSPPSASTGSAPPTFWLTPPAMIAAAASGIILLAAGLLVMLTWNGAPYNKSAARVVTDDARNVNIKDDNDGPTDLDVDDGADALRSADATPADLSQRNQNSNEGRGVNPIGETAATTTPLSGDLAATGQDATRRISQDAKRVLERISNEAGPYIPPAGVESVAAQVNAYRGSATLGAKLQAMKRDCAGVKTLAQSNGLKPALVMYAALARSADGRGDSAAAREMIPELLTLRATFGTDTANSSLLLVAATAYEWSPPVGTTTRTPHPLASKLQEFGGRQSSVETSTARSVWFLREKNGISGEAYDLVVRLLAVGVIAQNPRQYGINADALLC